MVRKDRCSEPVPTLDGAEHVASIQGERLSEDEVSHDEVPRVDALDLGSQRRVVQVMTKGRGGRGIVEDHAQLSGRDLPGQGVVLTALDDDPIGKRRAERVAGRVP